MNDEKNHNDPIERLFREKADQYDISYREEDWLKLEKQLDVQDMQRSYRRKLAWMTAASILILALIGYFTIENRNQINQLTEQLNQNEAIQQQQKSKSGQEPETNALDDVSEPSVRNSSNPEGSAMADSKEEEQVNDPVSTLENVTVVTTDNGETERTGDITGETVEDVTQIIRSRTVETIDFDFEQNLEFTALRSTFESVKTNNRYTIKEHENGFIFMADNNESSEKISPFSASRFAVGFVVSPDLSTAGSVSNFYDPGFKGGVMAEYAFTENISLISGIAISNLKYKAAGRAYHPPQYWNSGVMPDETTAFCVVLDIPLNLKVNLIKFDRSRIFTTAGLSSYIMISEDYSFDYYGDSSGLASSWYGRTGTQHWLSNAGFSIGFEYDLSPNWTLRAEPHIKVPLKGVGWGDVKLYSMGSFLSLNYRFGR